MGIYMSSNIYCLLLLYLNRMVLCRRIRLQTFNCDTFAVRVLQAYSSADCIIPFSFSIIIIIYI